MTAHRKIVFCVRSYNDLDHLTPVIHAWCSNKKHAAHVLVTSKREVLDDYRLQFLKKNKNLALSFVGDYVAKVDESKTMAVYAEETFSTEALAKILSTILEGEEGGLVVHDWIGPNKPLIKFIRRLVAATDSLGMKLVALPHGDSPYRNLMIRGDEVDFNAAVDTYAHMEGFEYIVVPNELTGRRYKFHFPEDRVLALGSPRYNPEWMQVLHKILPKQKVTSPKGKTKIVFFLRNFIYPIHWEEVIRTIRTICDVDSNYLIVKHHTRDHKVDEINKILAELNLPNLEIDEEIHSGSLIEWADYIIDLGTSVAFEAIMLGKPVLSPEYLHANRSTIAEYLSASDIQCREDLWHVVRKLADKKNRKNFYDPKELAIFKREIVGVGDGKVLDKFTDFLLQFFK